MLPKTPIESKLDAELESDFSPDIAITSEIPYNSELFHNFSMKIIEIRDENLFIDQF